jgi:PAS domain S-box-containing protein
MTHKQVINDAAQKILSLVDLIIIVTDEEGIILEANRSACELFCYTAEELAGMPIHLLLPPRYRERHVDALKQFVTGGETHRRMGQRDSVIGYRKDGALIELEAGIAKFHSGGQWIFVVNMLDITQRKHQVQELIRQSTHDALTGLPNRKLIHERLNNALQRSLRNKLNVVLLFIDLDGFKLINDTYGHITGDEVLKIIADRLCWLKSARTTLWADYPAANSSYYANKLKNRN